jgi:hypothetical protein
VTDQKTSKRMVHIVRTVTYIMEVPVEEAYSDMSEQEIYASEKATDLGTLIEHLYDVDPKDVAHKTLVVFYDKAVEKE